jgi:hypothetical protein
MLAVAVFSLAIYFWAQAVALSTDAIERLIAGVSEAPADGRFTRAAQ